MQGSIITLHPRPCDSAGGDLLSRKRKKGIEMTNAQKKISGNTGVQEWTGEDGASVNIQVGCEHNCRYCYAREMAVRFRCNYCAEKWPKPWINQKKVDLPYKKKYAGVVMFPTTHDITEANLSQCMCVLRKLLDAGNRVLVVSKPHMTCIKLICHAFEEHGDRMEFRFSIGSTNDEVLSFWEPGAPKFEERLNCLQYAFEMGYKTSVSCEPFLDPYPWHTYAACIEYITESFWIGKLNKFGHRVDLSGIGEKDMERFVNPLLCCLDDIVVRQIHRTMTPDKYPLIRWKGSIRKVCGERCRVCGCIEEDCRQCVEAQGFACHWVEVDLCSRCAIEGAS